MTTIPKADRLLGAPERRAFRCDDLELRSDGDGTRLTLTGYAAVFERRYDVFGGPDRGGFVEMVDSRAFDETLKRNADVHLLINHEGLPLARTKSGTLRLSTDARGLRVAADLDRSDPDVQRLEVKMARGDMDEMSFGFRAIRDRWNGDQTERRLLEVTIDKRDVSVVNFGMSPHTSVGIRSAVDAIAAGDLAELRSLDPDDVRAAHQILGQLVDPEVPAPAQTQTMTVRQARRLLQLTA